MIDGMEKDAKMPRGKLIENIKKGLGIDPADAEEFVFSEADKFFIPIPQTPL